MTDHLWSVEDLAEFCGVPVTTVYKWRTQGTAPPAYRVGRHVRFREADVLAWLEDRLDDRRGHDVATA